MAKGNGQDAVRRREHWQQLLRRWRAGGLSQAEFCRRRGIAAWKLAWWKRRLGEEPVTEGPPGPVGEEHREPQMPFLPVGVVASRPAFELELTLQGERVLRFSANVEAAKLAAIVAALEGIPAGAAGDGAGGGAHRC